MLVKVSCGRFFKEEGEQRCTLSSQNAYDKGPTGNHPVGPAPKRRVGMSNCLSAHLIDAPSVPPSGGEGSPVC